MLALRMLTHVCCTCTEEKHIWVDVKRVIIGLHKPLNGLIHTVMCESSVVFITHNFIPPKCVRSTKFVNYFICNQNKKKKYSKGKNISCRAV